MHQMSSTESTGDGLPQTNGMGLEEENSMSSVPSNEESSMQVEAEVNPEATNTSTNATETVSKPKMVRPIQETLHIPVTAHDLIEYEWPIKSSERYFLQEQIADLLDVKSFKRKYADMTRRFVEVPEKEYLQVTFPAFNKTIGEHQMHGMTALRAVEVRELMSNEYPSIYAEYQRAAVQRIKAELAEQQKAFDAIKNDKSKLEEMRRKAIQNASEFNSDLAAVKKAERRYFWDLQTSIIQSPSNRWMVLPPERTRPSLYPCSLITGQYQHYYKQFTPSELRRLPLNSVLDGHHLFPVKRPLSPPPIIVKEDDLMDVPSLPNPGSPAVRINAANANGSRKNSSSIPIGATPKGKKPTADQCTLCGSNEEFSPILTCATCAVKVHTDCIDMPDHIVEVAQSYGWDCIECKICTICAKPDNEGGESSTAEDKLMFCDRCDRGYHTFCVGLEAPPIGLWKCDKYCGGEKKEEGEEGEAMDDGEGGEEVVEKRATRTPKSAKTGPPPKKKAKKETVNTKKSHKKMVKVEEEPGEEKKEEEEEDVPVLAKEEPRDEEGETSTPSKTASPEEGEAGGRKGTKTPRVKTEPKEVPTPLTATRRSARKVVPKQNRD